MPPLAQIMACRLFSAKPLSEPVVAYYHWEQISVKFKSRFKHFIQENAFENIVCNVAAVFARPQCVATSFQWRHVCSTTCSYKQRWNIKFPHYWVESTDLLTFCDKNPPVTRGSSHKRLLLMREIFLYDVIIASLAPYPPLSPFCGKVNFAQTII